MRRVFPIAVMVASLVTAALPASAQAPAGQGGEGARQGREGGAPGAPGAPGRQGGAPGGGAGRQGGGPPPAPPAAKQVTPGLSMITGLGGNTTVRVDPEGLIIVDTKNLGEANYNQLMDVVKTVSTAPVKAVFVTHHHQDHSGNIGSFQKAGVPVTVHVNLNKNLETYNPQQGKPEMAQQTYTKDKKVKVGKARAEARSFGRGHTNGDTFVWFPDVKVVSAGDMIVSTTPNADMPFGGSVVGWVAAMDQVLKLPFEYVIPGHGNDPMTRAQVQEFRDKWNTILTRGIESVQKGTPKDQLLTSIKVDDLGGWNLNSFQPANRLDPLYAELQAAAAKKK
jgi:glyoxylase-like metal-dependent hydrolase (beta-lactamase superfamily II)